MDVIVRHDGSGLPNQLFIDPELCIDCGACEPECPEEAIFALDDVPLQFRDDIAINSLVAERRDEFSVPTEADLVSRRKSGAA